MDRFARTEADAEDRYKTHQSLDPFPEIQSAILNSADIIDYVATTGMVFPFHQDTNLLKPASYGVPICGRCIYWDESGARQDFVLSDQPMDGYAGIPHREELILRRNSIAFVTLEPTFRLPDYIAVRFNLAIREVYRGLLLGTGPLVDPGFQGKLSFPLHNLTHETYRFSCREHIVWIEFSKISSWKGWLRDYAFTQETRRGEFYPFPEPKRARVDVRDYLDHANVGNPVRSSIPVEIKTASDAALEASRHAKGARDELDTLLKKWKEYSIIGALAVLIATVGLIWAVYQVIIGSLQFVDAGRRDVAAISETNAGLKESHGSLREAVNQLQVEIQRLKSDTDRVASQSRAFESTFAGLEQRLTQMIARINQLGERTEVMEKALGDRLTSLEKKEPSSKLKQNRSKKVRGR